MARRRDHVLDLFMNDELADGDDHFRIETPGFQIPSITLADLDRANRADLVFPPIPPRRVPPRRPHHTVHIRRDRERGGNASNPSNPSDPSNSSNSSNPPVIDLTAEPDSPPVPLRNAARPGHPRRSEYQRVSPPRLSRSDSTVVGGGGRDASIIDLTADSPQSTRRQSSSNTDNIFPRNPRPRTLRTTHDELIELQTLANDRTFQFARSLSNILSRDLLRRLPHGIAPGLGGGIHVAPPPPSPKPPLEPIPPAREGFTRDTRGSSEEETVVVCPRCNEELAYDPDESSAQVGSRKRKRSSGEHHFWALKKCGHVYCAECFENRRPSNKSSMSSSGKGSASTSNSQDVRCAVDGCDTKAFSKAEWIGIFL